MTGMTPSCSIDVFSMSLMLQFFINDLLRLVADNKVCSSKSSLKPLCSMPTVQKFQSRMVSAGVGVPGAGRLGGQPSLHQRLCPSSCASGRCASSLAEAAVNTVLTQQCSTMCWMLCVALFCQAQIMHQQGICFGGHTHLASPDQVLGLSKHHTCDCHLLLTVFWGEVQAQRSDS